MNRKGNIFGWLYCFSVAVALGLLSPNLKFHGDFQSSLEGRVDLILAEGSFGLTGLERREFISHLITTAKEYEFDPFLILAMMKVESSFDLEAVSFAGAYGLLQIKPIAAKEVADIFDTEIFDAEDLMDPFVNVRVGVQYLSFLRDVVGKNPTRMLAAYNLGPTHVHRHGYNLRYASKVLRAYRNFSKS